MSDLAEEPADLLEHPLAFDRVQLDDRALVRVERAGLVDDLRWDSDLPDVVEECRELGVAPELGLSSSRSQTASTRSTT
jgi:hypothetical protein